MVADGENVNDYNRLIADSNIDLCKVSSILKSSILVRSIFSKILDCFEIEKFQCPYKKVLTVCIHYL